LTNVQSKRTTRAEPEDHLWSADHSLRNAGLDITQLRPVIDKVKVLVINVGPVDISRDLLIS